MSFPVPLSLFLLTLLIFSPATATDKNAPQTVAQVELPKYLGKWHEIARIPNRFQDNTPGDFGVCYSTIAEYGLLPNGKISVKNTCTRYNAQLQSKSDIAEAKAFAVEGSQNSKLKVNFTGFFLLEWLGIGNGDYWILGLGPINSEAKYSWALVGSPNRKFGWILSRDEKLDPDEEKEIKGLILREGYSYESFVSFIK